MGKIGNLRRLLAASAVATATLVVVAVSGAAPGTEASVTTFDQCANGGPPSTATDCPENWINGILNSNNSHYAEDEVTPQRVILELPKNSPLTNRTVEISYLTRKGGVHAYDSLATWNHTQTTADKCADILAADCVPGAASTFGIPSDPTVVADANGAGSATSGHQLAGQVFTLYGGTITGVSSYTHDDAGGTSDSYAHITLTYSVPSTADGAKVMLLFGGHLAPGVGPRGWGAGVGAGSISGGPYHIRITGADGGSVGNRDNQIMSGAILSPAHIVIKKVTVGGDGTFDYTATGGISSAFSITTAGGTGQTSFSEIAAGSYTVTESAPPAGWAFTNLTCQDEDNGSSVDLNLRKATIDLDAGETVTCTYTNTKLGKIVVEKQTQPDGDTQLFSFTPSYGSGFQLSDGQQNESGFLAAGSYSVSETVPSGWSLMSATCDDGSSPSSIDLSAGETVKCTFTNAKLGKIIVDKITAPANDPQSFSFSLTGGPDSVNQSFGLTHAATPHDSGLVKPGSYSVSETVPAGWSLTSTVCSDGSPANAVALDAGETVTCTFTNTKQSRIIVEKQTNPDGDTQVFGFTASYDPNGFSLTDGQQDDSGPLSAGTYSVSENVPAGWDLKTAVCSDQSPVSAIALAAGETVTCVFTNEKDAVIIVEKQTDPDGHTQAFSFTASYAPGGFSLSDGQQNNSGDLNPGTYSVSETVPAGWNLTSTVCSDASPASAIALAAGETVTCVFSNTLRRGAIIVEKQTNPDGDPALFAFTASYNQLGFSLSDGQTNDSGALLPGTYSVAETVPAGWDLASATCNDGSPVNAIVVGPNETVRCLFTNVKDANIIVEKQTNPDGDTQSFNFSASYDGDGFSLTDGMQNNSGDLNPGTYSVSENVPAGWDLKSAICSDQSPASAISLAAGETVTCVFTNEKDAKIIVEKQTDPNGHTQMFSFSASYDGNGFSLSDGQQNNSGDLDPGTYSVSENVPAGWNLTSTVCSDQSPANAIGLAAGETVTCVFTNTLKRGRIIVEKQTNPDSDPQVFSFAASYDQNGFVLSDGQQDDSGPLLPGTYSVSETVPAGWDLESAVCNDGSPVNAIVLGPDETVKCVFTNEKDANIIVEKQTNPNGDTQVFKFNASYDGDGFMLSDGQRNDSGDLDPGTYSVSETVPQGWDLASAVCDDGSNPSSIGLAAGETVTCVFTNEKDAKIIIEKQTLPNADPQAFHFDASYDEGGFSLSDGQSNDSGDLAPGTYAVSEDVPAGWALTSAICSDESNPASISLAAGETVRCVFTNTKRGTIIVEKQTIPDGTPGTFTFSGDAAGSIADNGQIVVPNLLPGTYTSTEALTEGWNLTSIACSDANSTGALATRTARFTLEAGETVKCTFTNLKPAPVGQGAIDVQKSADPITIEEPGGPVTFSVTVTNISNVKVAIENVYDSVFGDLDDDGGNGCFDVPVNLGPGEKVNCTFQRPVTGPGGTVHVNTVKAEGHDEYGNPVSDSDDARVEITPRLIDLVIVKEATSPTPLNGIVNYTMTVTNKGPNDATNVQVADPAPAGILYLSANPTQGTCAVTPSLITCSLGTVKKGQTVVIRVTARATTVGTHTNTATVTGSGGRETNPADNVDSAITVVPAPALPPVKPVAKQTPEVEVCLTLTVTPKMITADGRPDRVTVKVTAGKKRMRGTKVVISGAGVSKSARSNGNGMAVLRVNPRKAGLITITAVETNQRVCGPKRIGVVGVFLPPLTG